MSIDFSKKTILETKIETYNLKRTNYETKIKDPNIFPLDIINNSINQANKKGKVELEKN